MEDHPDNITEYKKYIHEHEYDVLQNFLKPFKNKINYIFTEEELLEELKKLYPGPTFCLGCHINALKLSIIDNLNEESTVICKNFITPTIIEILEFNQVNTAEIQTTITEQWYLEQEKKPKPVSEIIINEILKKPIEIVSDHGCFCGDENNKNVIKLACCGKYVHLECLLKWFKTNNTCPYCRDIY